MASTEKTFDINKVLITRKRKHKTNMIRKNNHIVLRLCIIHVVGAELTSCTVALSDRMFEVTQTWKWLTHYLSPEDVSRLKKKSSFFFFNEIAKHERGMINTTATLTLFYFSCLARLSGTSTDATGGKKRCDGGAFWTDVSIEKFLKVFKADMFPVSSDFFLLWWFAEGVCRFF